MRHGIGGFRGRDDEDWMCARRTLAQGDLRLVALALIAEAPRHGYDIIKRLQEKTAGWYSPSPGIVYPTLTGLQQAGYVTASTEGSRKCYLITGEGRAHVEANRDLIEAILDRLTVLGERVSRWRRSMRYERDAGRALPPLVRAALDHLRETVSNRLEGEAEAEAHFVEILARAAAEIQGKG
jgi:DNA-binding PadR family transcriptional regulator